LTGTLSIFIISRRGSDGVSRRLRIPSVVGRNRFFGANRGSWRRWPCNMCWYLIEFVQNTRGPHRMNETSLRSFRVLGTQAIKRPSRWRSRCCADLRCQKVKRVCRSIRHDIWVTMASTTKQATTIKAEDKKRKTVFRQLLDSPFNLTWYPSLKQVNADSRKSVDQETNNSILDVLCR
jgi:hypothetical protein